MDEINKYRRIIDFHYQHFTDQNRSGDKKHLVVAAKIVQGEFLKYRDYASYCAMFDIAGVSELKWENEVTKG